MHCNHRHKYHETSPGQMCSPVPKIKYIYKDCASLLSNPHYLVSANWQWISAVEILPPIKHGLLSTEDFLLVCPNHSLNDFPSKKGKFNYISFSNACKSPNNCKTFYTTKSYNSDFLAVGKKIYTANFHPCNS